MDPLVEGHLRFRAVTWPAERDRYESLAKLGQSPETMVIACSDSRVDPQTVFGAIPGELFVVRNVAGLVPPYTPDSGYHGTSAALEFAVRVLKVARIAVLGHAQCGGVLSMLEGTPGVARDFVEPWMRIAAPALQAVPRHLGRDDRLCACELEVVRLSLENLLTFPWISEAVDAGTLRLQGFRFDIRSGLLTTLVEGRFVQVG
ncbi:MAG: carbonic anhydrase [Burkholderiales bacterium]|nr:carbonic anhydrase [Burkholderiales bacterium]